MTLLSDLPKLREMELAATPGRWEWVYDGICADYVGSLMGANDFPVIETCCADCRGDRPIVSTEENAKLIAALRNAAQATIAVLGYFREGDAAGFHALIAWLDAMQKSSDFVISPDHMQRLKRLQKAASLMEGKGDE